jgi:hypothetical protein
MKNEKIWSLNQLNVSHYPSSASYKLQASSRKLIKAYSSKLAACSMQLTACS